MRVVRGRLERWLAGTDCVLSCLSSAGVDAALAGLPVIQLLPAGSGPILPHEAWGMHGTARTAKELDDQLAQVLAADMPPGGPLPTVFDRLDGTTAARTARRILAGFSRVGRGAASPTGIGENLMVGLAPLDPPYNTYPEIPLGHRHLSPRCRTGRRRALGARQTVAPPAAAAHPAPVSGWGGCWFNCAVVSSSEVIGNLLSSVTSVLLRMALVRRRWGCGGPEIFLSYANYANLGVSKGAARDLAVARGRGDLASAQRGLDLAFAVNTLTSLLYAAVLAGAGLWIGGSGGVWGGAWALGLIVVGVLAVLQRHLTFYVTILRSKQSFGVTSQVSILGGPLTLLLGGLGAWHFGLPGLYGGTILVMAGAILFVGRRGDVRLAWAWDTRQIGRLIAVGGPILLAGSVATLFRTLDKLMILGYLSDREFQLGCYSVALMVTTQLYGLANMLSIVMGPRYSESFGLTGSRGATARLAARATELQSAAMSLPSALAIVAAPALLGWLLPDYRSGLAPLVWLIPGNLALSAALPPASTW